MNLQDQIIALAEFDGWTRIKRSSGPISRGKQLIRHWSSCLYGTPPKDKDKNENDQEFFYLFQTTSMT